ncbi:MAG: ATP-binding protein [Acholeplasmatales bacterium]|nr:MAG: ATP-binding protein [Acholeplasmatales bacterium]
MYLKRKVDQFLIEWKNNKEKKPLVIKGPRQVGKTQSILKFTKENYQNIIYINFIEEPIYRAILDGGYNVQEIIKNISRIDPYKKFIDYETVLIFDEIQDFIEVSTALKFFHLDGRYDVICSGSLLGINYSRIDSVSTGHKSDFEMTSLDFEEFLWAKGYDQSRIELLEHMINLKPFSKLQYKIYKDLFIDYVILGGMPEVISKYINNQSFEGTLENQIQIIKDYREDIKKYASGVDKTRIMNVFNHIPIQLAKENKKFQLAKVDKNARFRDYRGVIEWLHEAGLINICYKLNSVSLPLKGNYDESFYKIYMKDTGLLVSMLDEESQLDLRANKNLGVYKGALYENMMAEAFEKSGLELYYYKNETSTLEIDFLVRSKDDIIAIEVKAKDGRSKSLKALLSNDKYPEVRKGFTLADKNIGYHEQFYTFPYFLSFLIKDYIKSISS